MSHVLDSSPDTSIYVVIFEHILLSVTMTFFFYEFSFSPWNCVTTDMLSEYPL